MYRVMAIEKRDRFKKVELCIADNWTELQMILRQERASGLYQGVWFERAY